MNQAASSSTPVTTDLQILSLLKKRKAAAQTAAKEAEQANRPDLKEKQEHEIQVLEAYAGSVKMLPVEELRAMVDAAIRRAGEGAKNQGQIMKELLRPGGQLEGKMVDRSQLAGVVKEALAGS